MTQFNHDLLADLIAAQLRHTVEIINLNGPAPHDDGADDVVGACDLTSKLIEIQIFDQNFSLDGNHVVPELARICDPASGDDYIINRYGEGVCPEIYALLPDDE